MLLIPHVSAKGCNYTMVLTLHWYYTQCHTLVIGMTNKRQQVVYILGPLLRWFRWSNMKLWHKKRAQVTGILVMKCIPTLTILE